MNAMVEHARACARLCLVLTLAAGPATAVDTARPEVRGFIEELATRHGFAPDYVAGVLADGETRQRILDAISRPAEKTKPWSEYRAIFLTPERIAAGVAFRDMHAAALERTAARTGVPAETICSVVGVETFYGRRTGSWRVVDALTTLAFDYPPRSGFFRGELEQLFLLARDEGLDIAALTGSYAGAIGPPQFIPSSYRAYAVDGDGDGRRDLLENWDDIFASVANYFVAHGWEPGQPVAARARGAGEGAAAPASANRLELAETVGSLRERGFRFGPAPAPDAGAMMMSLEGDLGTEHWVGFGNFYVITRYNRSAMYALAVHQLAEAIATGDATTVARGGGGRQ